jgi:hypothetical protein
MRKTSFDHLLDSIDPSVDHRGYISEVLTNEKGIPTGDYMVIISISEEKKAVVILLTVTI